MKYTINTYPKRNYYGDSGELTLNNPETMNIAAIWEKTNQMMDFSNYDNTKPHIGLELYPSDFEQTNTFLYCALIPVKSTENLDLKYKRSLPAGNYIEFECTFKELVNGFIPKIYDYIRKNNINVQYGFDYESYPPGFDHNKSDSIVHVGLKLKE